jgi:hypothetical protein
MGKRGEGGATSVVRGNRWKERLVAQADPPKPNDSSAPWEIAVQIAGAAAGFGAFVYLIGAITVWVRLTTARFPADVALDFMSKTRIAAIGLKGIGIILLILLPVFLLALSYRGGDFTYPAWTRKRWIRVVTGAVLVGGLWLSLRIGGWKAPVMFGSLLLVAVAVAIAVNRAANANARLYRRTFIIASTIAILLSALVSWRGLAVTLALLAFTWLTTIYIRRMEPMTRYLGRWLIAGLVALVGLAALTWQIQAPVRISSVEIVPPIPGELTGELIPYFGQTDSFVYVAEVTDSRMVSPGNFEWTYTHAILEVRRDAVTYLKFGPTVVLRPAIDSPAAVVWHWLNRVTDRVEGEAG